MNKFSITTFRNEKDFKFHSWSYEHKNDGGGIILGILKKNNSRCKYQEIKRVK